VTQRSLRPTLADLVTIVDAHLEHATTAEVGAVVVAPLIEGVECERECELIAQLEDALTTGGAAAAGLDEVLSASEQQRVATIIVDARARLAWRCPRCERLSSTDTGNGPLDASTLVEADAVEHAVNGAVSQSATVVCHAS
jgi:hypothetical protein